jgi:hypothetical protein
MIKVFSIVSVRSLGHSFVTTLARLRAISTHAVVARAHLAQSEPEMARNRFGFLERHGFVGAPLSTEPLLSRFAVRAGFVTLRQIFVRRCQGIGRWATFSSGWVSERRRKALGSKPSANRHPIVSFAVGILLALLIAAGAFVLLVSQQ